MDNLKSKPVDRISISLPEDLHAELDLMVAERGYESRSQAIKDMLRQHLVEHKVQTGKQVMVYGQTEVTRDLMDARSAAGLPTVYEADQVAIHDYDSASPSVSYVKDGVTHTIHADFIAGCDGFHGVCRASVPASWDFALKSGNTPQPLYRAPPPRPAPLPRQARHRAQQTVQEGTTATPGSP